MSPGPKFREAGGGSSVDETLYVTEEGDLLLAKLVSTLLGSVWLTVAAGWIMVVEAIARVHIIVLDTAGATVVRVIQAFGFGGARTLQVSWGAAFRAAVEAEPMLAPVLFSLEIVVVSALLLWARRRWV